jgi:hypothetical protein
MAEVVKVDTRGVPSEEVMKNVHRNPGDRCLKTSARISEIP